MRAGVKTSALFFAEGFTGYKLLNVILFNPSGVAIC
jgi:hypothetical protein